ncbi:hypothetical protein OHA72_17030 [Dactylosporangium sp. NBC_01737]|uniref:hypothetical protein n=1 Tax=Dactylosporangium sp. NBC_01737 TaxID=2975959 RepID=UPI002E1568BE|nr:hypothetical protein OHA72_17030 [Dactylosporangium sp. NBC_01737]
MVSSTPASGLALAGIDEAAIIALGVVLSRIGAPSPVVFAVPAACEAFALVYADPKPWYEAADYWSDIRTVTSAAATDLTNTQKALLADAWQDDGALEFRKYGDRLYNMVNSLNKLVDVTASECSAVGGLFLAVQIEFLIAMVTAILECIAASLAPDPTLTTQVILKTIILGVAIAIVGAIVGTIVAYLSTMASMKQKIAGAYAELAGHLKDQNGNLSGKAAALDPERLSAIGNPGGWKLAEIPPSLLH